MSGTLFAWRHPHRLRLDVAASGRARQPGVSVKTAESHLTNIMRKLGFRRTAGLVRYALRRGLSKL